MPILDCLIFLPGITLSWCYCKTGFNHFSLIHNQSFTFKKSSKPVKDILNKSTFCVVFTKCPYCFFVGYFITTLEPKKILKACSVKYLVFYLFVPKTIVSL